MLPSNSGFTFRHAGSDIIYGRACVDSLEPYLENHGLENALIVCGSNVSMNDELMDPIRDGLGDRFGGVFDGTTPAKTVADVYSGLKAIEEVDPDILIGIGGGSSLDTARQMSVMNADGRSLEELKAVAKDGAIEDPKSPASPLSVVVIPTTFAGAADSAGGSIEVLSAKASPTSQPIRIGGSVMPIAMVYDPDLFETTPMDALAGSVMNGFNKGPETIYANNAMPITDATAIYGLRLLSASLPQLPDPEAMEAAVKGIILVQFERQTNIIHAFGHGFSRRYDVQQGKIHAVMAPHVLRYLFDEADCSREKLAVGFDIDTKGVSNDEIAKEIVQKTRAVRDGFELPTQLREIDVVDPVDFPKIADFILADAPINRAPEGIDPSKAELESILEDAW